MNPDLEQHHYGKLLFGIFLFAFLLRVGVTEAFVGLDAEPDVGANTDQKDYEEFAHQLALGNGYCLPSGEPTAIRPPGTSLALAPAYLACGRSRLAGRLWFCLLSALTCVTVAFATRQRFSRRAALTAAALLAVYPGHFYYTMHFLSEVPYPLWISLFVAFALRCADPLRGGQAVLAGLCLGMAILVRPQAILILPIAWVLLVALPGLRRRPRLQAAGLVTAAAAAVVTPWIVRNAIVLDKATLSTIGGYTFWGAHNPVIDAHPTARGSWMPVDDLIDAEHPVEGSEVEREDATWRYGKEFVREHLERMPTLLGMKLWRLATPFKRTPNRVVYWVFAVAWTIVGPAFLVGMWLILRAQPGTAFVLFLPLAATIATALVFYGSVRFRDSVSSVFVIPAAIALTALLGRGMAATRVESRPR